MSEDRVVSDRLGYCFKMIEQAVCDLEIAWSEDAKFQKPGQVVTPQKTGSYRGINLVVGRGGHPERKPSGNHIGGDVVMMVKKAVFAHRDKGRDSLLANLENICRTFMLPYRKDYSIFDADPPDMRSEKPFQVVLINQHPREIVGLPMYNLTDYAFVRTARPFYDSGGATDMIRSWAMVPVTTLCGFAGETIVLCKVPSQHSRYVFPEYMVAPDASRPVKPDDICDLIEWEFTGPRAEVFGGQAREGWTVFGGKTTDDVRNSIEMYLAEWNQS